MSFIRVRSFDTTFNNLTSVFVPKIVADESLYNDFNFAEQTIDLLVDDEKGCPWDKVQTHQTLKRYLLEETFELFEAIDNEDDWHMVEELETYFYRYYCILVSVKRKAILI